jgi:hypothetical protein
VSASKVPGFIQFLRLLCPVSTLAPAEQIEVFV